MNRLKQKKQLLKNKLITLDDNQTETLFKFEELIKNYNKKTNLISYNDLDKIWERHFLDSLEILKVLSKANVSHETFKETKWADMGSGAGFPVIPLCIALPNINFCAIEVRLKRATFLKVAKKELNLSNLKIVQKSIESCKINNFDVVTSRALGSADEDWFLAKNLLKKAGVFITLKKANHFLEETALWERHQYSLDSEKEEFCVLLRWS